MLAYHGASDAASSIDFQDEISFDGEKGGEDAENHDLEFSHHFSENFLVSIGLDKSVKIFDDFRDVKFSPSVPKFPPRA